ncbi:MAG: glycosyltransferase family 9 protein [Bacteriovoracaceae bacterium]|jgi:ADP-heptose:LPS heptosyltransferase|nr:hypothetical protein [Halobacteriovoraceae bacterium]MDP7321268.1 glycosyltransferase family 9 protein [Bacteriovoracaceae bacterium]
MNKEIKVAIIQLTRIGDLIQTLQAARQFKAENPEAKFTLIARKQFAQGILFLLETVFDDIILFDTKEFFKTKQLAEATKEVNFLIDHINQHKFDLAINLSYSKSSTYLCSLIQAKCKFGPHRNTKNEILIEDKWSQYVYSNVLNGTSVPFSLVDIYRYIMGVQETLVLDPDPDFHKRDSNIVLHPFASQRKKKWGLNRWNELIYKLAQENPDAQFYIVGGQEDADEAARLIHSPALEKLQKRIHIRAGKDKISDTYQLLSNAKLFIGHDSMVSHLAAETLTPSLIISLGTVKPFETSSYSAHTINIVPKNKCFPCKVETSCELLPCHGSINYQVVSTIASAMFKDVPINTKFLKSHLTPMHLNTAKIFQSDYDANGLTLNELSSDYKNTQDVFKAYYKIIWLYYLRSTETNAELPEITKDTAQELYRYLGGVHYLFELYNFGVKYSNKIIDCTDKKETDLEEIQDYINKLGEIDQLCHITKKAYPLLQGLVDYFYVNKANALGNNLKEITQNNLLNYYDASNLAAVINDFIEKSVNPHIAVNTDANKEV